MRAPTLRAAAVALLAASLVAGSVIALRTVRNASPAAAPTAAVLPWSMLAHPAGSPAATLAALAGQGLHPPRSSGALAILYVQSRCVHCLPAARRLQAAAAAEGVRAIVVTSDSAPDALRFAAGIGGSIPVLRDSARAFARALDVQVVPTLVLLGPEPAVLLGLHSPRTLRLALRRARTGAGTTRAPHDGRP